MRSAGKEALAAADMRRELGKLTEEAVGLRTAAADATNLRQQLVVVSAAAEGYAAELAAGGAELAAGRALAAEVPTT